MIALDIVAGGGDPYLARVKVRERSGAAAEWTSANTILLEGEEGFESDTGRSKVGPGAWNDLPYQDARATTDATAKVAAEAALRTAADAALAASVSTEAGARASADTALSAAVAAEATTRGSADAALTDALATKASTAALTTEVQARQDLAASLPGAYASRTGFTLSTDSYGAVTLVIA